MIGDVVLTHEAEQWGQHQSPLARLLSPARRTDTRRRRAITFAGHTHYRQARDERGHD